MKIVIILVLVFISKVLLADVDSQKAWTLHNRITGVPPQPGSNVLNQMTSAIKANPGQVGLENAARIAMNNRNFYDLVLKNWIKPWSNVERSKRVPLNDFVATVVGAIRDSDQPGKPFSRILYEDMIYVGPATGDENNNFSRSNNNHYEAIESDNVNLMTGLVERRQSQSINTETISDQNLNDVSNVMVGGTNGAAGVITTRASGLAFFDMGTNRRVTRYALMNFICKDLEDLHDTNLPDNRVRKDVERAPGGDSRSYRNKCVGCHAGQDALGGAFAYYEFEDGALKFEPGVVQEKIVRMPVYSGGFETIDDSWINYWGSLSNHNADVGFKGPFTGRGPASLGKALSDARGFSICMAKKTFKLLCIRPPAESDNTFIESIADGLEENSQYNMKEAFAKTAAYCVEDKYAN